MPADVIVGLQWGDEGKGKIVDYKAKSGDYKFVTRYQGGNNAGHTVVLGKKTYAFHLIPSGVVSGQKVILGNGMVINPDAFLEEVNTLKNSGLDADVVVSDRAHIITPEHIEKDRKEGATLGTTGRGIGPTYEAKVGRRGIRAIDYVKDHPEFGRFVQDTVYLLNDALDRGENVLLEGAQATMLDIDFGTYPYVTSSSTTAGGACIGTGISPKHIRKVIGVAKAYTTRVGNGPFPTELTGDIGDYIRQHGKEIGTTTGRNRRTGWFDNVVASYASKINCVDEIAITKLDVLTGLDPLEVCESYNIDGKKTNQLPVYLDNCQPNYTTLMGWSTELGNAREIEDLPIAAHDYVGFLNQLLDYKIKYVGVGAERNQIIEWNQIP